MFTLGKTIPVVLAALAVGVSACGDDDSTGGSASIPSYEPSRVVSESDTSRTLLSSDPVEKVSSFYVDVLDKRSWETTSKSVTRYSANLTVEKADTGASISIAPAGGGSTISISEYPSP
jgi:hypothetical protein